MDFRPRIIVDYASCKYGLSSPARNDTILPLEYDEISSHEGNWLMTKGGKMGVVSQFGQKIIPAKYDFLHPTFNQEFIVSDKQKFGIIDWNQNIKIPFKYDSLFMSYRGIIVFKKGDLFGVMDSNQNILVTPQFEAIQHATFESYIGEGRQVLASKSQYLKVKKAGKWGLYHLTEGMVIPCSYYSIKPQWQEPNDSSEMMYAIVTLNAKGYQEQFRGIVNHKGKMTVPPRADYPNVICPNYPEFKRARDLYTYQYEPEGWIIYNVNTGERSAYFDQIKRINGVSFAQKGPKWGVFDNDLNIIWLDLDKYPFDEPYHKEEYQPDLKQVYTNQYEINGHKFHPIEGKILLTKYVQFGKQYQNYFGSKFGLLDTKTNNKTKVVYNFIRSNNYDKNVYYWMYKGRVDEEDSDLTIDIYDKDLKRIERLNNISQIYWKHDEKTTRLIPFRTTNERYGVLNYKGDLIYPAIYNDISLLYGDSGERQYYHEFPYLVLEEDNGSWLIDPEGKMVFDQRYDFLQLWDGYLMARRGDSVDLYTLNMTSIIKGVSSFFDGPLIAETFIPSNLRAYGKTKYLIKNEQLFTLRENHPFLVDNNLVEFEHPLKIIQLNYADFLINQEGVIIQHKYGYDLQKVEGGYTMMRASEGGYFLNEQGEVIDTIAPLPKENTSYMYRKNVNHCKPSKQPPSGYYFGDNRRNTLWKQEHDRSNPYFDKWFLYDTAFSPLSSIAFDYPVNFNSPFSIIESMGKFGLVNGQHKTVVPPRYDYICSTTFGFLLEKDNEWGIYNIQYDSILPPSYDAITTTKYPNGYIVFEHDKIGVLDLNFQSIIPLSFKDSIIKHCDLANTLWTFPIYYRKLKSPMIYQGNVFHPTKKEAYRKINNERILAMAEAQSTDRAPLVVNNCSTGTLSDYRWNKNQKYCRNKESSALSYVASFNNRYYYAEYVISQNYSWLISRNEPENSCSNSLYKSSTTTIYQNFEIKGNQLVPITIYDIIKSESEPTLDKLLLEAATDRQVFGPNCANIDYYLTRYKENFLLGEQEIYFYTGVTSLEYQMVSISYTALEKILKHPYRFHTNL